MKLATRMAVCLTLLAGLLIVTSLYQLRTVDRIHSIGRDLAGTRLEAGRISLRLEQDIAVLREFATKALVLGDQDYVEGWTAWEKEIFSDLRELDALPLDSAEAAHRDGLHAAWRSYLQVLAPQVVDSLTSSRSGSAASVRAALADSVNVALDSLGDATRSLREENAASITLRAQESVLAVDQARQTAWLAGGASLVLAVVLSIGLFVFTSGPLRRLNHGTQEIAGGNFNHRIRVRGGGELAKLAEDFNKMASKLGEVDELKKDFVSHVSHELKGPVAAIQETNLILLDRIPGPLTKKQAHLLELSHQSAGRLSVMIQNLLGVSRLEARSMQYHFELQDVAEITCDVVDELSALSHEKELDVRLEFAPATNLSCDPERLREVVANLVGNAYKFSPRGGIVRIGWRVVDAPPVALPVRNGASSPYLLLTVEDEGPGVPDAHKEGIFEKFYQVRRHTRTREQGVGLGLAIARKIVEAHGGRIWVEDAGVRGSRFQAVFPGAVTAQGGAAPVASAAPSGENGSQLVALDVGSEQSRSSIG